MSRRVDVSVYGILDPARARGRPLPDLAAAAARGGATLLQLRDKASGTRALVDEARAVLAALAGTGVELVINDRVDVALAAGAAGVHVGAEDMAPEDARGLLGAEAIVGVTIHSLEEALAAPAAAASYFGAGPIYQTSSKNNALAPLGPIGFAEIRRALAETAPGAPVVGIAGVTAGNAADVIGAGADGVAVISDIFMADDVELAARKLASAVHGARGRQ